MSDRILKAARRKQYQITRKADKFLNDLNTEIEQGWTVSGQTNRLLGRIAMRSYIFGHALYSPIPLEGEALANDIVTIARSLPGYENWCGHQHEIEERAKDWAKSIEQSHYYHYGSDKPLTSSNPDDTPNPEPSHNEQTRLDARERIRPAVADLLEKEALPQNPQKLIDRK